MIFVSLMLAAFLYGAVNGYQKWKAQQVLVRQKKSWWN